MSSEIKAFLKQHVSERTDNPTRRQWHEKHGVPCLAITACPKVDKILKQNLSSQTKARDRQLSKSQALILDGVSPLAFVLESAAQEANHGSQDNHVPRQHTHPSRVGDSGPGTHGSSYLSLGEPGTGNKPPQVTDHSISSHRIPSVYH